MNADIRVIIAEAQAAGVDVSLSDVVMDDVYGATVDGMPLDEWCAAMLEM
ncbi:hypothetical protein CPT_Shaeky_062 [Streptomyces phage Shaeky]|uniref:Uncharacterized protein n=1 Tax=Streptomyces phage Shaeky TaxID=2767586 RepID=A0A873WE45_9CAUD|nr:hypothetical protein CPT_Shaeky_062 [Streptomyces phage Shaeky]